ncbi:contractile injection system protein, VgrG/Pvc8 family [Vibrio ostreicida]|uniref:Contractile injection system protein, VgrG/Pvc8 family n=1 Tax=Vibrio ostreicida TaxID=526588 RepID=A0ABT8BYA2_9VIBR|nr:contractile injection system protein, VgrG/Pvc8 family [Vibrio ostreicida]MDN3611359.1 contractile injection system protein, VgrG/Pvc8 family [Vibrio ostreicida]NPD09295.1 phage tail protein [Vibrio ostreicida]
MGLDYQPGFSLSIEGEDITPMIQQYLTSLTLTDNAGSESDRLNLTLTLPATIATPKRGTILHLGLGFNGELYNKGAYVVDEVSSSGPPKQVQIVANAAPMDNRKQPGSLQTQKTRSFNTLTLGDLVKTVASKHGLVPRISASLEATRLAHVDQVNESDMSLLTRLATRFSAVSKPANGYWLFLKQGEGKSVTGKTLANITLTPEQVTSWQCRFSSRNAVRRVVATYHDVQSGMTKTVSSGSGEPELRIVFKHPNQEEARQAVASKAKSVNMASATLDLTLPARAALMTLVAEGHVTLAGFGTTEDGEWRVKSVEWSLSQTGLSLRISGDRGGDPLSDEGD